MNDTEILNYFADAVKYRGHAEHYAVQIGNLLFTVTPACTDLRALMIKAIRDDEPRAAARVAQRLNPSQ